jgi:hypothetical protein
MVTKQLDPMHTIVHLSHTFRLVNERLAGDGPISNTTIAVVILLATYERLRGQYRQSLVHLEGLRRMIELRGGIYQLTQSSPSLAQKIFRYHFK